MRQAEEAWGWRSERAADALRHLTLRTSFAAVWGALRRVFPVPNARQDIAVCSAAATPFELHAWVREAHTAGVPGLASAYHVLILFYRSHGNVKVCMANL